MADEKMLRHILELARGDVLRGQAPRALEYLRTILSDIDDLPETPIWAEYQLIYAGALAGMNDRGAEAAFEEALMRISVLPESDAGLLLRAHEDFGRYLAGRHSHLIALKHYKAAEGIAVEAGMLEDAARVYLCIVRIDLESSRDPRLESLQNLKKAAKDLYTAREQQRAWVQYCQELEESGRVLVAARKGSVASVDYFRGVLSTVRRTSNEAAD
jgi:hypothetical protein